ncbi:MAG: prolyl oligopeptidase family serine peptidase [Phycisphaeraceae bacterium]|nr:prolyl oligopeptidase family serine peptidase [Phycisphaeraceae bacterium]
MKIILALSFALLVSFQGLAMTQQEDRVEAEKTLALDYLIALPEGYDKEGDAVPLMLFLHGAGERGRDLGKVKKHGPPKMIEQGHDFGAIVVSPQCPKDSWWTYEIDALIALIDKIEHAYNVDEKRIYVTGLSMGGYGTFALCARQPERFAAAVPVCGGGELFATWRLTKLPMWVFHGENDRVVPVEESRRMVEIMNRQGGKQAKLTTYPGVGHNSWDKAYSDNTMWRWLLEQKRQ